MDWKNKIKPIDVNLYLLTTNDVAGAPQGTKSLKKKKDSLKNSRNAMGMSHIGKSVVMAFIWIIK